MIVCIFKLSKVVSSYLTIFCPLPIKQINIWPNKDPKGINSIFCIVFSLFFNIYIFAQKNKLEMLVLSGLIQEYGPIINHDSLACNEAYERLRLNLNPSSWSKELLLNYQVIFLSYLW